MSTDIVWMSAHELRGRIADRSLSPVEVITAVLARIEVLQPALRPFITISADRALAQARIAEQAVMRGVSLGALHGVPVALKDEAWTEGIPSTGGSLVFSRFVPSRDGTVAERLRAAGAIIVGKTNLPEFAAWPRSKTRLVGESRNPWDPSRISGASSGGSAVAVAAGIVPIAIGSDGGGSTRIPSAFCGVSGLFPTPGRVPSYGSFSYSPGGSLGPIARDLRDVALVQDVIAGPEPRDAGALTDLAPATLPGIDGGIAGLRIGWSSDFGRIPVDARISAAAFAAVSTLEGAGARVGEITTRIEHPWGDGSMLAARQADVARQWGSAEADADIGDIAAGGQIPDLRDAEEWMWRVFAGLEPLTATAEFRGLCLQYQHLLTPPARLAAQDPPIATPPPGSADAASSAVPLPEQLRAVMRAAFESYDLICTPTMAVVAPLAQPGWATPYDDVFMGTNFTFIANATGCPAASVPCGLVDGLPVGLQVIGRPGDEATVLRACRTFEAFGRFGRPPLPQ